MLAAAALLSATASGCVQASCHCGAVVVKICENATPHAQSYCHCKTCRALSGAPYMANLIFAVDQVELIGASGADAPKLLETQTSQHVVRKRCSSCYSPVAASLGTKRVVVPAALFDRESLPSSWHAQHHLYYDKRIVDVDDDLPKYRGNYGGDLYQSGPGALAK